MSAEPSTESAAAAADAGPAAGSARAATPPRTEREINAPTPLAMSFLGVVFLATFFPWVTAKVACNVREAPARLPPELPLEILARQPKDAALELQQRAASGRYREAAELAKGDAQRELLEADARCQADPKPCEALRASAESVTTRAVLVGRGPLLAQARVESQRGNETERYVIELQAEGNRWYAMSRKPFGGDLLTPVPVIRAVPSPGGMSPHGAPAPQVVPSPHPSPQSTASPQAVPSPHPSPQPAPSPQPSPVLAGPR